MFGGEPQKISFNYYGSSVEAVLDKFPMAKVVDEKEVCAPLKPKSLAQA